MNDFCLTFKFTTAYKIKGPVDLFSCRICSHFNYKIGNYLVQAVTTAV